MFRLALTMILIAVSSLCAGQAPAQQSLQEFLQRQAGIERQYQEQLQAATTDTARLRLYVQLAEYCDIRDNLKYAEPGIALAEKVYRTATDKETRIIALQRQGELLSYVYAYYRDFDPARVEELVNKKRKLLEETKNIGDTKGTVPLTIWLADRRFFEKGDILGQLEMFKEGLAYSRQAGDLKGQSRYLIQMERLFSGVGDTAQALNYLKEAQELELRIADSTRMPRGSYLTGLAYFRLKHYDEAITCFRQSIGLYMQRKDTGDIQEIYMNLGETFREKKELDSALFHFNKGLEWSNRNQVLPLAFLAQVNLGDVYSLKKDWHRAIDLQERSLALARSSGMEAPVGFALKSLATTYFRKGDHRKAKEYADEYLPIAKKSGLHVNIYPAVQLVYRIDSAAGDFESAFLHFQEYIRLKERTHSQELARTTASMRFHQELETKELLYEEEKQQQRLVLYSVVAGCALLLVLAGLIYRSYRIKQKANRDLEAKNTIISEQKKLVEEKHKEITDSISYAERIQRSFLPSKALLNARLGDYFVFFRPKDVVSGDFYWTTDLQNGDLLFVVADSTGHGVPGAIMSMLNIRSLNEAVENGGLTRPADILDSARVAVIRHLSNDGSTEGGKDGMDAAVITVNKDRSKLSYAGANNPAWIVRNGALIELAPDKMPVGRHDREKTPFSQKDMELVAGDMIYLFTDGYADQFGGGKGKKFMYKKLKELLISVSSHPAGQQRSALEQTLDDWKKGHEQVDDITVVGMRV